MQNILSLAHLIILSGGWKRRGIAFLAGAFGALSLAPIDFIPAMIVPLSVSVWLIDGTVRGVQSRSIVNRVSIAALVEAAGVGWWLGFGYFLAGLWWLGSALLVEADKFLWALPIAVFGLPAGLSFFTALGFMIARVLWCPSGGRVLALAAGLGLTEWARGFVFTGFPWNSFGMALGGNLVLGQVASIVGLYGLTVLAVAIFASPATLIDKSHSGESISGRKRVLRSPFGWATAVFVAILGFGAARLATGQTEFEKNVRLRIMQPNLPQDEKFRPENKDRILRHYLSLSDRATSPETSGVRQSTHLIWPESAFPFILSQDAQSLARIGAFLGDSTILITGAARSSPALSSPPSAARTNYFNSVQVIGKGGIVLDSYDKTHLVPFGEYLPFSNVLEKYGVRQLVHIPGGFEAGKFRKALSAPGLPPIAPLVCYEAVFPGEVTPSDGKGSRPALLLNLTNDGWFGNTIGPYQHFAQARLRAIEEGIPLIRAANTGISAFVDAYGRVLSKLPLNTEGVLDGDLPKAIKATVFAENPLLASFLLLLLAFAGAIIARIRFG